MAAVTTRPAQTGGAASIVRVLPLALVSFAAGTDDMVIAGVLPEISTDLDVSQPVAGQLITVYALMYALATPVVAVLTARLPRRSVLACGLAAFVTVNLLAAVTTVYAVLFALRLAAGLAAAAMTPAAFAIAAEMAPEHRRGRYLGLVTSGLPVSLVAGVPLGTWLGGSLGWQATMLFVAGVGAVAGAGLVAVPAVPGSASESLRARIAPLRNPAVLRTVAFLVVCGTGGMMQLAYIAPTVHAASSVDYRAVAAIFTVVGVVGIAAAWLGGHGADNWGPRPTLWRALTLHISLLGLISWAAWRGDVPLVLLGSLFAVQSLGSWAFNPPVQMLLLRAAPDAGPQVLSLQTTGLFLGTTLGGILGGVLLGGIDAFAVPLAGAVLGVLALPLLGRDGRSRPSHA
ncbi:putative MFS family arabinose efflux permease [Haloactinopolyspora alba]|uniref:Putative MFS family arabinose efflux permease n=1 Tax=Haloactinopolyspora alba TaxID=648780 RepID=A0A2P8E9B4_9ACTN|nr:MFS transporter [Haloactinopolyspora alba]PSL06069.1 putative MFS family arabinose efflux permease [Haloactinopolyspora alba]